MPQFLDARRLSWTASSEELASELLVAIDHFLTFRADSMNRIESIIERDPECPSAWILKGFLHILARSLSHLPMAQDAHRRATSVLEPGNPRESLHASALQAWAKGDLHGAQMVFDHIVTEYPHDLLALRLQHINAIFYGRPDVLLTTVARTLPDWDDEVPGAGILYGIACMGFEEVGQYKRAEELGRRGVELEPDDLWSIHSVAHVMEAQGRLAEGIEWMQRPDSYWADRGPMRHHLWWHEALFMFEAADYQSAIHYYDDRLAPRTTRLGYLEMCNCASLLYRLEVVGQRCGDRWAELIQKCSHLAEDRALTFSDVHMIVALTMAREGSTLNRMAKDLSDYAAAEDHFDSAASARISVPLAKAMQARMAGDPQSATDTLLEARFDFQYMGGSIAQRDMLDILLIDCAIEAQRDRLARKLLSEYRHCRPHSVPIQRLADRLEGQTSRQVGD